jgi:hypothetical protein
MRGDHSLRGITGSLVPAAVPLKCEINGQRLDTNVGAKGMLQFALIKGKWLQTPAAPDGIRKRSGLQGPWIDPFTQPALYVVPSNQPAYSELAAFDLETLQRSHGGLDCSNVRGRIEIDIPIKKDRELTTADIAGRNLIVFGDPSSNSLLAKIHDRLPIHWSRQALLVGTRRYEGGRIGAKFVYPNPLNPYRYVAVTMGTSAEALHALRIFHWQLPDFLIFSPDAVRAGDVPYYNARRPNIGNSSKAPISPLDSSTSSGACQPDAKPPWLSGRSATGGCAIPINREARGPHLRRRGEVAPDLCRAAA